MSTKGSQHLYITDSRSSIPTLTLRRLHFNVRRQMLFKPQSRGKVWTTRGKVWTTPGRKYENMKKTLWFNGLIKSIYVQAGPFFVIFSHQTGTWVLFSKGLVEGSTKDIHERILIHDRYYSNWSIARFVFSQPSNGLFSANGLDRR